MIYEWNHLLPHRSLHVFQFQKLYRFVHMMLEIIVIKLKRKLHIIAGLTMSLCWNGVHYGLTQLDWGAILCHVHSCPCTLPRPWMLLLVVLRWLLTEKAHLQCSKALSTRQSISGGVNAFASVNMSNGNTLHTPRDVDNKLPIYQYK